MRPPSVRRDLFRPESKIAIMDGDVHIARFAADGVGRDRNFVFGGVRRIGPAIQEFRKQGFVSRLNNWRLFGNESGECQSAAAINRTGIGGRRSKEQRSRTKNDWSHG